MNLKDAAQPQYRERVDAVIFADNGPMTPAEWIDLAYAALDQARMPDSVIRALQGAIDKHAEREG